jgi:hypothetical protein
MKKPTRLHAIVALLLVAVLLLAACDSFERNAYRTLKVTKVEYELLQEHAARAFLDGRMTQAQWERFAVAGNRFIAAHTLAADLMKTYQQVRRAGDNQEKLDAIEQQVGAVLADLPTLLGDLRTLLLALDAPPPAQSPSH